jgi:hypothetical protein
LYEREAVEVGIDLLDISGERTLTYRECGEPEAASISAAQGEGRSEHADCDASHVPGSTAACIGVGKVAG